MVTGWLTGTGPAAAQAPPAPCDPASVPVASLHGLPDELIFGRDHVFNLSDNYEVGWATTDYQVTMSENGIIFWSGAVDEIDVSIDSAPNLFIRSDPGDQPLTVSVAYTEYRLDAPITADATCQRVVAKTMPGIEGQPPRTPVVRNPHRQEGQFRLRAPDGDGCETTYAPTPVAVSVRPKGSRRWTTAATHDQCVGWRGVSEPGRRFRLRSLGDLGRTLLFVPRTPRRDGIEDFAYKVSRATVADDGHASVGRTLRRGTLRVTTRHEPRERVYGFHSDGSLNDRYWNYCVNRGKKVWMDDGNPYCIDPASTTRKVDLRR
jgi:hypothetical protein